MNEWLDPAGPDTFQRGGEEDLNADQQVSTGQEPQVLADNLWLYDDGAIWDLGPPEVDVDADGVAESLTRAAGAELTVYSDCDLDGRVDRITAVADSGETRVSDLDPVTGQWRSATLGRVD